MVGSSPFVRLAHVIVAAVHVRSDATRRDASLISCFSYRANEGLSFSSLYIVLSPSPSSLFPLIDGLESIAIQRGEGVFFFDQSM